MRAASIMCRIRTSSGCLIQGPGRGPYLIAEEPAQILIGPELDVPVAEQPAEFQLHAREPKKPRCAARLELDEKVDVVVGALLASTGGAEERESLDATGATESGQWFFIELHHSAHVTMLPSASKTWAVLVYPGSGTSTGRHAVPSHLRTSAKMRLLPSSSGGPGFRPTAHASEGEIATTSLSAADQVSLPGGSSTSIAAHREPSQRATRNELVGSLPTGPTSPDELPDTAVGVWWTASPEGPGTTSHAAPVHRRYSAMNREFGSP